MRVGGGRVRSPGRARTWGFSLRLHKALRVEVAARERPSVEGERGVGTSRGGSAPSRPALGRGARGSAGRGGVGFQSASDSGRGPGAGSLPAEAAAQRRLCSLQEGRAARRPFASAPSGLRRPARWRPGTIRVPVPRPPRPFPDASLSLAWPLLAGGAGRAGACCGRCGSPRFSLPSPGPALRQVSDPACGWHWLPRRPREAAVGGVRRGRALLIPGHKRESSPLRAPRRSCRGFPGQCAGFQGRTGVAGHPGRVERDLGTKVSKLGAGWKHGDSTRGSVVTAPAHRAALLTVRAGLVPSLYTGVEAGSPAQTPGTLAAKAITRLNCSDG